MRQLRMITGAQAANVARIGARHAAGEREILEPWFEGYPIRNEYLIVEDGKLAGAGAPFHSAGHATRGSEEAARFRGGDTRGQTHTPAVRTLRSSTEEEESNREHRSNRERLPNPRRCDI
jgi:hypothetical protein